MLRRRIKLELNRRSVTEHTKRMGFLSSYIANNNLWHVNRHSVAKAVAVGLFCAYLPIPGEMVIAAILAVIVRANLPISVLLVWISNPLTWAIIYGPPYLLGTMLLGNRSITLTELSVNSMMGHLEALWLGSTMVGVVIALGGFVTVHILWRMDVVSEWEERRNRRAKKRAMLASQKKLKEEREKNST